MEKNYTVFCQQHKTEGQGFCLLEKVKVPSHSAGQRGLDEDAPHPLSAEGAHSLECSLIMEPE